MLGLTLKFRQNTFKWQVKNITQICLQRKVDLARSIQQKMNLLYETFRSRLWAFRRWIYDKFHSKMIDLKNKIYEPSNQVYFKF